jgi:hypothetical protein
MLGGNMPVIPAAGGRGWRISQGQPKVRLYLKDKIRIKGIRHGSNGTDPGFNPQDYNNKTKQNETKNC